jgi:hypothetical protein
MKLAPVASKGVGPLVVVELGNGGLDDDDVGREERVVDSCAGEQAARVRAPTAMTAQPRTPLVIGPVLSEGAGLHDEVAGPSSPVPRSTRVTG